MQSKTKLFRWMIFLASFFIVQTLTFYTLSVEQLESKLLPEHFQFPHDSDSVYVRDFFKPSEDPPMATYLTHNLKHDPERLKAKLNVRFVYFEQPGAREEVNEKSFNLIYHTWIQRGDWLFFSNFYKTRQVEQIIFDKERLYTREVTYRWFLFFWIKSYEFIECDYGVIRSFHWKV